jgi:signal transduction histidine kinase
VQDRGRGFDPVADRKAAGSHFGLFSVKERMEAMGGRLDLKSAPGQGTTATLVLPLGGMCEAKESEATDERRKGEMLNVGKRT